MTRGGFIDIIYIKKLGSQDKKKKDDKKKNVSHKVGIAKIQHMTLVRLLLITIAKQSLYQCLYNVTVNLYGVSR